ncbi:hypothetical protein RHS03_05255, partial [Rhizoctonia solani]
MRALIAIPSAEIFSKFMLITFSALEIVQKYINQEKFPDQLLSSSGKEGKHSHRRDKIAPEEFGVRFNIKRDFSKIIREPKWDGAKKARLEGQVIDATSNPVGADPDPNRAYSASGHSVSSDSNELTRPIHRQTSGLACHSNQISANLNNHGGPSAACSFGQPQEDEAQANSLRCTASESRALLKKVKMGFRNAPISIRSAEVALKELEYIILPPRQSGIGYKPPKLDQYTHRRLNSIASCLRLYCNPTLGWTFTRASEIAAIANSHSPKYGAKIRQFIQTFIETGNLPMNNYGVSNHSILENEDLASKIKAHIQSKGKYVKAEDIVKYMQKPEVRERFKTEEVPCLRTAQRWMRDLQYRWTKDPKGQYTDGHEREDVVNYCNNTFIPNWTQLEKRMRFYNSNTMEVTLPNLAPGEAEVVAWMHDESIYRGGERQETHWVPEDESPKPMTKSDGGTLMVSDYISVEGWLRGNNQDEHARVVLAPGNGQEGYMTNIDACNQLKTAIKVAKGRFPAREHVFIYDNATIHTKQPEDAPSARKMPLKPSKIFGVWAKDESGKLVKIWMANAQFADGSPQELYFPPDHLDNPGKFKGMAEILWERGIDPTGLKAECPKFKCAPNTGRKCCAQRVLFNEPDFVCQKSILERIAESHGCRVIFLPKFHCKLNAIEQCWGYAKHVYRQFPPSKSRSQLKINALASLDAVPLTSMRRRGLNGQQAAWATKKYQSHWCLPADIVRKVEAEFHKQCCGDIVQLAI